MRVVRVKRWGQMRRRSSPTCASPPARRARGRATPYRRSPSRRRRARCPRRSRVALRASTSTSFVSKQRVREQDAGRDGGTRRCRSGVCLRLEHAVELGLGGVAGARAVVQVDDRAGEQPLGRVRMQRPGGEPLDRARRSPRAATRSRTGSTWAARRPGSTSACRTARPAARRCRRSCRATSTSSSCRRDRRAAAS